MRDFTWCMAVPTINDLQDIRDFLETIPHQHHKNIILTDNTPDSCTRQLVREGYSLNPHFHPENAGIARGWNNGLSLGRDYTILCSASMRFKDFDRFLEQIGLYANAFGLLTEEAWHLIVVGAETVERCGLVDENYYPAYCEDLDYGRRWDLAGIHQVPYDHRGLCNLPKVVAPVTCIETARALKQGKIHPDLQAMHRYYEMKWKGPVGKETAITPYGEDVPLSYWRPRV